jgi:hypothetical protein
MREGKSDVLQSMFLGFLDVVLDAYTVWKQCRIVCGNFEQMIGIRVVE